MRHAGGWLFIDTGAGVAHGTGCCSARRARRATVPPMTSPAPQPSTVSSLWLPTEPTEERALTSATLVESAGHDRVTLYVAGEQAAAFDLTAGLGAKLLAECGMEREP